MLITPEGSLEKAAANYRAHRESPEVLSDLYQIFWNNFGANLLRRGHGLPKADLQVSQTPYSSLDLSFLRQQRVPEIGLFLPQVLSSKDALPLLEAGFPGMESWLDGDQAGIEYTQSPAGWMHIESSLYTPYPGVTQEYAQSWLKGQGRLSQTIGIYVAGAWVSKALEGRFFDERSASWLPGVLCDGQVGLARFDEGGNLSFNPRFYEDEQQSHWGFRSLGTNRPTVWEYRGQ